MRETRLVLYATSIFALTSGCAQGPVRDVFEGVGIAPLSENRSTGVHRITYEDQLKKVDLKSLLDPEGRAESCISKARSIKKGDTAFPDLRRSTFDIFFDDAGKPNYSDVAELQCAFNAFYTYSFNIEGKKEDVSELSSFSGKVAEEASRNLALIMRRNAVQDQVIAVSEKACTDFKIELNDRITKSNFALGSIATTLAGLGAIFVDPATSRGLSGASAIISGINSNYNESYLQSLTVKVITAGIDLKRSRILDEINGRRFGFSVVEEDGYSAFNPSISQIASRPYLSLSPYDRYSDERKSRRTQELDELESLKFRLDRNLRRHDLNKETTEEEISFLERNTSRNDEENKKLAFLKDRLERINNATLRDTSEKQITEKRISEIGSVFDDVPKPKRFGVVPLSQYSVEMAVADANRYHGACTITSGLEEASESVSEIRNPGVETMQTALDNINAIQQKIIDHNKLLRDEEINALNGQLIRIRKNKEIEEALK